jgi:hypothetical protein
MKTVMPASAASTTPRRRPATILAQSAIALALFTALAPASAAAAPRVLIFGEQHDQPDQQRQVAAEVARLAADGTLGGLVLEMAEAPHSTVGLPRDADAAAVRAALRWHGWPWSSYAEVVMNAVRAGVPVWGGNLPRDALRAAIGDGTLDAQVPAATRAAIASCASGARSSSSRSATCRAANEPPEPPSTCAISASMVRTSGCRLRNASSATARASTFADVFAVTRLVSPAGSRLPDSSIASTAKT